MPLRLILTLALFAVALLGGCRNAPEAERELLRNEVRQTTPEARASQRARLKRILVGDAEVERDADPHLRAAAAQGLGELGDAADAEVLRDTLLGVLRDDNLQVRMECAIALGKLRFDGPRDPRRMDTIRALRDRIAFERDDNRRPLETEFLVRTSMLNSLIALGGHESAAAIHEVARRVNADLTDAGASLFTSATDRGLLDRCFEGLSRITGVPSAEAAAHRVETGDMELHLDWWADRISRMRGS